MRFMVMHEGQLSVTAEMVRGLDTATACQVVVATAAPELIGSLATVNAQPTHHSAAAPSTQGASRGREAIQRPAAIATGMTRSERPRLRLTVVPAPNGASQSSWR